MKLKSIFKQVAVLSLVGAMAVSLSGCGDNKPANAESGKTTLNKDTLIVGLDDSFAPMGFRDEKGELVGFDVDAAKALCEQMGKKVELQPINWDMKETELNSGNIDLIWNGYTITDKRKELVEFSVPYLENKQVILTLAGSDIQTKADLVGKKVGAQNGSSAVDAINGEAEVADTFAELVTYEDNNQVLMDLEAGRIDAAVADEVLIKYYISNRGPEKFNIIEENFGDELYGVGIRKGDTEMVEAFNEAYDELKQNGKLKEISEKWFGEDITK